MQYQSYPEFKDSNIEWFGSVPKEWNKLRLKWTVLGCKNGVWGAEPDGEDHIYCIRVADFNRVALKVSDKNLTIRTIEKKDRKGRLLQSGDLLLEKSGGGEGQLVGAVSLFDLDIDAVSSNFIALMQCEASHDPRYLTYLHSHLYSCRVNSRSIKQTTGIQNLDSQQYLDEFVFLPEVETQRVIAKFLDYKTQQIDQLIEKKKALIEKLNEQRIAVITQAVTKGSNKKAKMKPSGVDWLGDVPEHWEVKRLKFMATIQNGRDYKDVETEDIDGYTVYGSGGAFKKATEYLHDGESVLFGRKGTIDRPMYVNEKFWTVDTMFYTEINEDTSPKFLFYSALTVQYQYLATQTALPSITQKDMEGYLLCCPNLEEQHDIVKFIEEKVQHIDEMLNVNNKTIEKLEEYRAAIITDAATGKIDVRNVVLGV